MMFEDLKSFPVLASEEQGSLSRVNGPPNAPSSEPLWCVLISGCRPLEVGQSLRMTFPIVRTAYSSYCNPLFLVHEA
jgi:hypothetical protein